MKIRKTRCAATRHHREQLSDEALPVGLRGDLLLFARVCVCVLVCEWEWWCSYIHRDGEVKMSVLFDGVLTAPEIPQRQKPGDEKAENSKEL